ncbi:unnamed protein product [Cylindrotheca closterium]|uniref:Uncharacterized protein n=1 Tax=Cylindrotheca closterium TaxID=2856 RepID=A0AAD2PU02_9STRA|nr:unnamed protein product [Cylindrotheca closterium]
MVSKNTPTNNTSCEPTVTSNAGDHSLLQSMLQGTSDDTATSSSSSSAAQEELPQTSNRSMHQDMVRILDGAIKLVTEDALFFPSNDLFMSTPSPEQDGGDRFQRQ